jgi:hypothetical protein
MAEEGGSDWHDLASRLAVPPLPASKQRSEPRFEWEDLEAAEIAEALLKAAGNRLSDRERNFLEDMISWTATPFPSRMVGCARSPRNWSGRRDGQSDSGRGTFLRGQWHSGLSCAAGQTILQGNCRFQGRNLRR